MAGRSLKRKPDKTPT